MELRKTLFARAYSADKNVSIFLGRPSRMSKRFCYFQIPLCPTTSERSPLTGDQQAIHVWKPDACMSYEAEACWSALCASVKEEILELLFDRSRFDCFEKAR